VNPQYARTAHLPPSRILEVNGWLKNFCEQRHFPYVDYYSALVDKAGFMQADLADDGLHPNAKGYRLMAPIAMAAIDGVISADAKPAKKKNGVRAWLTKEHK
jgi:lysophospholipase L1-like esterase